jgi:hypothetical protein
LLLPDIRRPLTPGRVLFGGEELDWSAIGRLPAADAGIAKIA